MWKSPAVVAAIFAGIAANNCSAATLAYSTNEGSGTVSVIDTSSDNVIDTFPVGDKPRGAAITPDGKVMYVSDQPHNSLIVIDLTNRKVISSTKLSSSPEGVGIRMMGNGLWWQMKKTTAFHSLTLPPILKHLK
jgi:YVTN family beta-propeller protein